MDLLKIDIYGYAGQLVCSGCEGHDESSGQGQGGACASCRPGDKQSTTELVKEFAALLEASEYKGKASVEFFEADDSIKEKAPEVHRLLSMADLSPAIAVNGKVLYLGGFSPAGLLDELRKRYPLAS
jgi:hypothetical protein